MKILTFLIIPVLLFSSPMFTEVGINSDKNAPDYSAMPEMKSTTKGFLPPLLTYAERNAITAPSDSFFIGQTYGCGIVFYIDGTGRHGLIAATNQSIGAPWGCSGTYIKGILLLFMVF